MIDKGVLDAIRAGQLPEDLSDEAKELIEDLVTEIDQLGSSLDWSGNRNREMKAQHERVLAADENKIKKEFINLLNYIACAGKTGDQFIGLRFPGGQIRELRKLVGLDEGRPDERYIAYDVMIRKYASNKAALEAALVDLRDDDNAGLIFNLRRVLGLGAEDDVLEAVARIVDVSGSNDVIQLATTIKDKDGEKTPSLSIAPGSEEVH